MSDSNHYWEYLRSVLRWFTCLLGIAGIIFSAVFLSYALSEKCDFNDKDNRCLTKTFVVNTYLKEVNPTAAYGWPTSTDRYDSALTKSFPKTDVQKWQWAHYYDCMTIAKFAKSTCNTKDISSATDYSACLLANNDTKAALSQCQAYSSAYFFRFPTADQYAQCLASQKIMEVDRYAYNVFQSCIAQTMWPFFETPQKMDSTALLGSFNWVLFLVVALWIMTSFTVYAIVPSEDTAIYNGEPHALKRLGEMSCVVSTVWNILLWCIILVYFFRQNSTVAAYPLTTSTVAICFSTVTIIVCYYLSEAMEGWRGFKKLFNCGEEHHTEYSKRKGNKNASTPSTDPERAKRDHYAYSMVNVGAPLANYDREKDSKDDITIFYGPGLMIHFTDGYIFDCLFLVGIAGATAQLTTSQAWILFSFGLAHRLLNSSLIRIICDAFILQPPDYEDPNTLERSKRSHAHSVFKLGQDKDYDFLSMKVMALGTQLAVICLIAGIYDVLFDKDSPLNDFSTLQNFFILGVILPEAIRVVLHLICQYNEDRDPTLAWACIVELLWVYDFVLRISFIYYVYFQTDTNNKGTRRYLQETEKQLELILPSKFAFI